jgi:hypothetical protein
MENLQLIKVPEITTKKCSKCGYENILNNFYKNSNICKTCVISNGKEYRLKNKDKIKERYKEYCLKNKDKIKERHLQNKDKEKEYYKQYRITNKNKRKLYNKEYSLQNKDNIAKYNKEYYLHNMDKRMEYLLKNKHKNYALKKKYSDYVHDAKYRNIAFNLTIEECQQFYQVPCYYCGKLLPSLGIDRVNNDEGYTLKNCVPCCSRCNRMKMADTQEEFLQQITNIYKHFKIIKKTSQCNNQLSIKL